MLKTLVDIEQGKNVSGFNWKKWCWKLIIYILIGNVNANSGEIFDKDKLLQSEKSQIMFQSRCFQIN